MRISVKEISQKGFEFIKSLKPDELGLTKEDVNCVSPIEASVEVERILNSLTAKVQLKINAALVCDRCLENFAPDRIANYTFNYMVEPNMQFVDLGEDIRQEIIMNLPSKSLCRDDCKGICSRCGMNLNKEQCECAAKKEATAKK